MIDKETITGGFENLQNSICEKLEEADGKNNFREDVWERPGGGGGKSRIIENGRIIEKGGVNFSSVYGETPKSILKALSLGDADFYATGVSIVIHPENPHIPIIHMNVRYFEMSSGIYWFGGGIDLTPHYIVKDDAVFFHQSLKNVCDKFDVNYYPKYKKWADDYFFINHRNETRGIGGIFFDRLKSEAVRKKEKLFQFVLEVGKTFTPIYCELIRRHENEIYSESEKEWQYYRRGRYVEFNLVYDKGTKFGLDTNGRTESILMSMPPYAKWEYNFSPIADSNEANTLQLLKKDIDWLSDA